MRASVFPAAVLFLAAGCADNGATDDPGPTDEPGPPVPPPKQVLEREGNNAQCSDVLTGAQTLPFTVESGYSLIEVSFHASGLGNVGYEIRDANGTRLVEEPPYNPTNQPCDHAHEGGFDTHAASSGEYTIVVQNQGIVGWHLIINQVATPGNATHGHG